MLPLPLSIARNVVPRRGVGLLHVRGPFLFVNSIHLIFRQGSRMGRVYCPQHRT